MKIHTPSFLFGMLVIIVIAVPVFLQRPSSTPAVESPTQVSNANFKINAKTEEAATPPTGDFIPSISVDSRGRVGIGTTSPKSIFEVSQEDSTQINAKSYSNSQHASFRGIRARGSATTSLAVNSGDTLVNFAGAGYDGRSFTSNQAKIHISASENWNQSSRGTNMSFYTTENGTKQQELAMTINHDGNVSLENDLKVKGDIQVNGELSSSQNISTDGQLSAGDVSSENNVRADNTVYANTRLQIGRSENDKNPDCNAQNEGSIIYTRDSSSGNGVLAVCRFHKKDSNFFWREISTEQAEF